MRDLGRTMSGLVLASSAAVLCGCVSVHAPSRSAVASAAIVRGDGSPAGEARLFAAGSGMILQVDVHDLSQGVHGLHLHESGRCDGPDFTSAKGHWNPTSHQHGSANPAGPHAGDMPNLKVGANGRGRLRAALNPEASAAVLDGIFDDDGTAVVIHAGSDDFRTDPSGQSGARIACGVLARR
jgi:Cu-Zn family superoxide dismutase